MLHDAAAPPSNCCNKLQDRRKKGFVVFLSTLTAFDTPKMVE